jgi:hypothetical protein
LPLAVELVAGQASGRSLAELVELVRAPLDVPAEGSRRPRQRSLRRTFATSLDRLDPCSDMCSAGWVFSPAALTGRPRARC